LENRARGIQRDVQLPDIGLEKGIGLIEIGLLELIERNSALECHVML
jgi:hypothetical protein